MAHRLLALTLIYFVFIVCTFLYVNGETMNSMQSGQTPGPRTLMALILGNPQCIIGIIWVEELPTL
jgi:hypothetical protein